MHSSSALWMHISLPRFLNKILSIGMSRIDCDSPLKIVNTANTKWMIGTFVKMTLWLKAISIPHWNSQTVRNCSQPSVSRKMRQISSVSKYIYLFGNPYVCCKRKAASKNFWVCHSKSKVQNTSLDHTSKILWAS